MVACGVGGKDHKDTVTVALDAEGHYALSVHERNVRSPYYLPGHYPFYGLE
jgi:hypothetical protein